MTKLTPAQRKALIWIAENEPVSAFPCDGVAPSLKFVCRLRKLGFVEEVGKEPGFFGFTKFGLTDHARSFLPRPKHGERP